MEHVYLPGDKLLVYNGPPAGVRTKTPANQLYYAEAVGKIVTFMKYDVDVIAEVEWPRGTKLGTHGLIFIEHLVPIRDLTNEKLLGLLKQI